VFRVTLPAAPAVEAAPRVEDKKETSAARMAKRGRILIVDDDAMIGKTLSRVLKGHDVAVFTDAREALKCIVAGERFDLILCDLMMPEMTGMELHTALSSTCPELCARMVFLTGGAFTPAATDFLDRVPNERIDKPFESSTLRAVAQRHLG
jgi:CheY-like chemotaxis protein